jgi:AraC family transcriptional activator of pobA
MENFCIIDYPNNAIDVYANPLSSDSVKLGICTQGHAEVSINGSRFEIHPGVLVVVLPNFTIQGIRQTNDFAVKGCQATMDYIAAVPRNSNFPLDAEKQPCLATTDSDSQDLKEFFDFIALQFYKPAHQVNQLILLSLLQALLHKVNVIYDQSNLVRIESSKSRENVITEQFFELLLKNYKTVRSALFYANALNLTRKHLSSTVKQVTGKPITDWIDSFAITEIKKLLKSKDLSISEIADELHFSSLTFLCRFFKKHTGLTPIGFRRT